MNLLNPCCPACGCPFPATPPMYDRRIRYRDEVTSGTDLFLIPDADARTAEG